MNNWTRLLLRITVAALIITAVVYGAMIVKNTLTLNGYFSSGTLAIFIFIQLLVICLLSWNNMMPIKPLWLTVTTLTLYLLVGQLTFEWANRMIPLVGLGTVLNFLILGLFVRAFLHAPSGEIKKAEIGRFEFAGSPFPVNIVLSQGGATVPHFFGWEVLNRITPLFAALSVKLSDGTEGTVGISVWFRVINPSTLDEYDLQKQVIPRLQRLFEGAVRNWASQMTSLQFSNQNPIMRNGVQISSIESLEGVLLPILGNNVTTRVLQDYGLAYDDLICTDPKLSKAQDKVTALKGMLSDLTQNSGLTPDKALNTALVLTGDAQLLMLGLNGSGKGGKGGSVIADIDDQPKGKGGKDGKEEKKDEKKLSDPPKAKKGGYKVILFIWTVLAFINFVGWGKHQTPNPGDVTASEVLSTASRVVSAANPAKNLPPGLPKSLKSVIVLVDKGNKQWIVSNDVDQFGLRDTDQDGWISNRHQGYRDTIVIDWQFDASSPSSECEIEAELSNGDIHTYVSDKSGWYHLIDGRKIKVNFVDKVKFSKKMRFRILDPDPSHTDTIVIRRESLTYQIPD